MISRDGIQEKATQSFFISERNKARSSPYFSGSNADNEHQIAHRPSYSEKNDIENIRHRISSRSKYPNKNVDQDIGYPSKSRMQSLQRQ